MALSNCSVTVVIYSSKKHFRLYLSYFAVLRIKVLSYLNHTPFHLVAEYSWRKEYHRKASSVRERDGL